MRSGLDRARPGKRMHAEPVPRRHLLDSYRRISENAGMSSSSPLISVVTPVYMAEACIEELCRRLIAALVPLSPDFEIIMVEDASPDRSWNAVCRETDRDPRCKGIRFTRNFGQHVAITAGLAHASGEWVVVMDCDLQDQPEEIPKLLDTARTGEFDVVFGRRAHRRDPWAKRIASRAFYAVYNYFTDQQFDNSVANFSIMRRHVAESFLRLGEHSRSFPLFIRWLGFPIGYVDVTHAERYAGKASYTLGKLVRFAAESIICQSNKPLHITIMIGLAFAAGAFLVAAYYVAKYFLYGIPVTGWASTIVSIWFLGGLLLANLGVVGLYLGRVFNETKRRPLFVIRQQTGLGPSSGSTPSKPNHGT